jgi:hypothetical protein
MDDQEQGTREVVQQLRKRPPLIARVVGTEWVVFLTEEGLEYCKNVRSIG